MQKRVDPAIWSIRDGRFSGCWVERSALELYNSLKEDRDNFRKKYSKEFELLDEHCESFTEQEKLIGDFDTVVNRY